MKFKVVQVLTNVKSQSLFKKDLKGWFFIGKAKENQKS